MSPAIVLIDGEHYPPVVGRAVEALKQQGEDLAVAILVGGGEKLGQGSSEIGIEVEVAKDPERDLAHAIERFGADKVIDISDEPVLGYVRRCRLASVALWKGASYVGGDFSFTPPPRQHLEIPAVGIIGTGKRTGKTAIGGTAARVFDDAGYEPVVVAMGRGGPEEPEVLESGVSLEPERLLEFVEAGRHAASDYIEDALVARVPTVGAWRAGGGLAGATSFSNYAEALKKAVELKPGLLVLEGSGAALPPARWDAGVLVVNASIDPGHLCGYFGLYRLLLADLVVLTMVEMSADRTRLAEVIKCIRSSSLTHPKIVHTVFRPNPLGDVSGKKVWLATTAGESAADVLRNHLENEHDSEVVGISHNLADRKALREDLEDSKGAEVLLVELKAAAVDVVTRHGLDNGKQVVYVENKPQTVEGDDDVESALLEVAVKARDEHR